VSAAHDDFVSFVFFVRSAEGAVTSERRSKRLICAVFARPHSCPAGHAGRSFGLRRKQLLDSSN